MVIVWGTKLCGKVDEVPGLCHVATKFGHMWYIPLIPMGTHAVFEQDGDSYRSAPLPFSGKSLLVAWFRTACVIGMLAAIISGITLGTVLPWVGAGAALFTLIITYFLGFISKASYERASEIARHIGLTEEGQILLDVQYGRLSEDDAGDMLETIAGEQYRREEARARARETKRAEREARRARKSSARIHNALAKSDLRAKAPRRRRRLSER